MDFGTTLKHLAPFVIPIIALFIPIVAVVMSNLSRMRRNAQMHETVRHMVAQGQPVPSELIQALMADTGGDKKAASWSTEAQFRAAAINVAVGLALMLFLSQLRDAEKSVWLVGCIPLFIGVALLIAWSMEKRQKASKPDA
jgi:Domain of unknown function (DUF6249)